MGKIKCNFCGEYYDEMYSGALNNGSPACPKCVEDEERAEQRKQQEAQKEEK